MASNNTANTPSQSKGSQRLGWEKALRGITCSEARKTYVSNEIKVSASKPCVGNNGFPLKCHCLKYLEGDDEERDALAKAIVKFSELGKETQKLLLMERIRSAIVYQNITKNSQCYVPPSAKRMLEQPTVCERCFMEVYRYGRNAFGTLKKNVIEGKLPSHGLKGKRSNAAIKFMETAEPKLQNFFQQTVLPLSEPLSTRFVEDEVSVEGRDESTMELDSAWSKRRFYSKFLWENGYKIKTDRRGKLTYAVREDEEWTSSKIQAHKVCSWATFQSYWIRNYSCLVIRKSKDDQTL